MMFYTPVFAVKYWPAPKDWEFLRVSAPEIRQ
jgi:hypothetical protein